MNIELKSGDVSLSIDVAEIPEVWVATFTFKMGNEGSRGIMMTLDEAMPIAYFLLAQAKRQEHA